MEGKTTWLIALLLITTLAIGSWAFYGFDTIDQDSTPYSFNVALDGAELIKENGLNFGTLSRNSIVSRSIVARNNQDYMVQAQLEAIGTGASQIEFGDNFFRLEPGQERTVSVWVKPRISGSFTGTVVVSYKQATRLN
jgi:hypothetical protein